MYPDPRPSPRASTTKLLGSDLQVITRAVQQSGAPWVSDEVVTRDVAGPRLVHPYHLAGPGRKKNGVRARYRRGKHAGSRGAGQAREGNEDGSSFPGLGGY